MGVGAIGIVRLSGAQACSIAGRIFEPAGGRKLANLPSHQVSYGRVHDHGAPVDEVLVLVMLAPRTYTREHVVEIHCHGGPASVRRVLELVLEQGARLARPGEFTRRAFENGRIDLSQAEAVLDVIQARTRAGLRAAQTRLSGQLGRRVFGLRAQLLEVAARLEASIDYPDEHLGDLLPDLLERSQITRQEIDSLLASAESGRLYRQGLSVALAGRPNVGKSSLFNRLIREARAIVTEEPGTTRDVLEETINLQGVPVRLLDAAGLRDAQGEPERHGIERAHKAIEQADLVLLVLDGSQSLHEDDLRIAALLEQRSAAWLPLANKSDLPSLLDTGALPRAGEAPLALSALTGDGIEALEKALVEQLFSGRLAPPEDALIASTREADCLNRTKQALDKFSAAVEAGVALEAAAIDLQDAMGALGELVGEIDTEEILEAIFGRFCIGK